MTALGPWATPPDTARAFAAAEAAYLEPDEPCSICEGECDDCVDGEVCGYCRASDGDVDDWDEHEWEMRQDAKEAREGL